MARAKLPIAYWILVALCLLGLLTVRPLILHTNPRLAVLIQVHTASWEDGDPWGTPWQAQTSPGAGPRRYSVGLNGRDEHGAGDDVLAVEVSKEWIVQHRGRRYYPAYYTFLAWPERWLGGFLLVLIWLRVAPLRAAPRAGLRTEVARSLWLASIPALLAGVAVDHWLRMNHFLVEAELADAPRPVLPLSVAAIATVSTACFFVALAYRLSRPHVSAASASHRPHAGADERDAD